MAYSRANFTFTFTDQTRVETHAGQKGKVVPVQARKAERSGDIDPLILNLAARWR
jgi:hypothetical protein